MHLPSHKKNRSNTGRRDILLRAEASNSVEEMSLASGNNWTRSSMCRPLGRTKWRDRNYKKEVVWVSNRLKAYTKNRSSSSRWDMRRSQTNMHC